VTALVIAVGRDGLIGRDLPHQVPARVVLLPPAGPVRVFQPGQQVRRVVAGPDLAAVRPGDAGEVAAFVVAVARQAAERQADFLAGLVAFKGVLLEGLEVVFIVIAVGAGRAMLGYASLGAAAASALVIALGLIIHRPLARVPENALKFVVGIMLTSFGIFWTGEGLGAVWPGEDLAIPAIALIIALFALAAVATLRGAARARRALET